MDLLAVVRKAQSLNSADGQEASICALKPFWLDDSEPAEAGNGDLVSWRGTPSPSDCIKFRTEEEERLASELNQPSSVDKLLRPYLEQVNESNPNPNPNSDVNASGHPGSEKKGASQISLSKLLKKASPLLGQKLRSSILRALCSSRNWECVRAMLDSPAVSGNIHPELVSTLIEHDQSSLLCMWIRNIQDPRFSDLFLVLKYFLKAALRAGKNLADVRRQWRHAAVGAIQRISNMNAGKEMDVDKEGDINGEDTKGRINGLSHRIKMGGKEDAVSRAILLAAAVDNFQPFELCLHYFIASGHDEAVLASVLSQLDSTEVLKLLGYLKKWLQKYCKKGSLCTLHTKWKDLWIPSLGEVLQWISILLDVHLTSMVLSSDFHGEILSVQTSVKELVDVGHKLAPLVGVTDHLRMKGPLPTQISSAREDDHVIEYLEF